MSLVLGPIVGALGTPAGAEAAALADSGEGFDYAIGGLGFRLAINDERKYERATAQFRKEQYDTSDNPGDQSLLGYWTRGQLSFHKGAGQRYAELGEDTDTRYWRGVGANPFIKGEVSLYPSWAAGPQEYADITDVQPVAGNDVAVLSSGTLFYGAAEGFAIDHPGTASGIATGGGSIYAAMSTNVIDRIDSLGLSTTIYSHTAALSEIHYVKDRLFVMDADGVWYQLAPNPSGALPVAIAAADKVFSATTSGDWTVCDTPGPVLLGNGNRIFAVTQDASDGMFPTLTSPIQVADLPIGESVVGMAYYLGFAVLATTRGVRVAVLGDGGITYGPRLVDWSVDAYKTGLARGGESVYVAADSRIIEVNLSTQVGQGLEFGWAELPSPFLGADNHGVTQVNGRLVAWGEGLLQVQQATPTASGYIETSFHRFGTLEPKRFHTVQVRTAGEGGTVTISKVTSEGSVDSLYTMSATEQVASITLRADEPLERLALRFTLNAEGANSPTLLSYQLRALPAPKRQRMIRVPLAMHDVERRGTTRAAGRQGSAWDRLSALEELEAQSSVVTYQDFRTGESGQCYIEQVAFEGDTPPGRQGDGFGGTVFVTLRTL